MSFGSSKTPSASPKLAGIDQTDLSSNQPAVPVRYVAGEEWCPLTWVTDIHNAEYVEIKTKVGKQTQTTGNDIFGDVAGIACLGVAYNVTAIESANEVVWTGSVTRPDDPLHAYYWRAPIVTSVGTFYVYWGRLDQPVDDILLAGLGATSPDLEHPAYRGQVLVVCKRYNFNGTETVPNTRIRLRRVPAQVVAAIPQENSAQGENIVAAELELATNTMFGAAMPASLFDSSTWLAHAAAVLDRLGCLSVLLDRERPLRDIMRDAMQYFDGWGRIENGLLVPGLFPHDGVTPAGLTEISHHDIIGTPDIGAPAYAKTKNSVTVKFRNRANGWKDDSVGETARANAKSRGRTQPTPVDAPWIIDSQQAGKYAAERARAEAQGDSKGSFEVRRPRAVDSVGNPLQAGDNFNLDWLPIELDQVSRITKRVDPYRGPPKLYYVGERGLYPGPYRPPADLQADLGKAQPTAVASQRILELTTDLAGSPLGIYIAVLAKRPLAEHEFYTAFTAKSVVGFNLWYSADGGSYDPIGQQSKWAVRGVLRDVVANDSAPATVKVTLDADNLDSGLIVPLSAEDQADDTLLLVMGDEIMSVGDITVAGYDWDLACLRGRQGSNTEAGAITDEVWLVFRSALVRYLHKRFIEDQDRYFKLQTITGGAILDLADAPAVVYHFRNRADELPQIAITSIPASMVAGRGYFIAGNISDVNGDLVRYQVNAAKIVGGVIDSEFTLAASDVPPDDTALFAFKAPVVWPQAGTWRVVVRAWDERSGYKEVQSADLTIAAGDGAFGPDDGVAPGGVSEVTASAGLGVIFLEWTPSTTTPLLRTRIYENTIATLPSEPSYSVPAPQAFLARSGLASSTTRYYWLEEVGINGRKSAIAGPYNATTRAGIDLSDIVAGMTMVEIVAAIPATGNFTGRTVYLNAADAVGTDYVTTLGFVVGKIYRWDGLGTKAAPVDAKDKWTAAVKTVDLSGTVTNTQIADDSISTPKLQALAVTVEKLAALAVTTEKLAADAVTAGKIAAGAITATAVGANEIIANIANIANALITGAKIANATIGEVNMQDASITTAKIGDLQVSTLKIADDAVTVPVSAFTSSVYTLTGSTSTVGSGSYQDLQSASITTDGNPVELIASWIKNGTGLGGGWMQFRILRDSTTLVETDAYSPTYGPSSFALSDAPGAGTYTYKLQARGWVNSATHDLANRALLLLLTKK